MATQEIAQNACKTSSATAAVVANISGVQEAVATSNDGAAQVLSASRALARQSELLRSEVEKFLMVAKAA
jgi:methyl-accepting chemotaxis protein